ncbi:MAG TPA: ABC transporter ATP-binding protein [Stellaceae bacterium]|nr:ABC transporter ATP-binding protein [Stellaceae bacterium]
MTEPVLRTEALSRRFGGLAAVSEVAIELRHGEVHALIGPNGAGKTTLINLLSGNFAPSSGSIRFEGREIAGLATDRVARLGIARSYQRTTVFRDFTAFENCRLAAQARLPSSMRFIRPALSNRALAETARRSLALVGLEGAAGRLASALSHGEQRQLEIAMTLAMEPKVLLLDEPLAGMGAEESRRMVTLIAALAARHAILLVEHDMDAVFSIAQRLTVMVNGRVLESGTPEAIRESAAVQEAYLGGAEAAP